MRTHEPSATGTTPEAEAASVTAARGSDPGALAALAPRIGNRAVARMVASQRVLARWDSPEHVWLGETAAGSGAPLIRLASHARDLPAGYAGPMFPPGWRMRRLVPNSDQLRVMTRGLTYGEVIALSGDFYRSWQELSNAPLKEVVDLIPLMRNTATTGELQEATAGRYLRLASQNVSHFSNVARGQRNVDVWRSLHTAAIQTALQGNVNEAWGMNGAADHFLTDAFSGGHIRTPRDRLMAQGNLGNIESKILHDLDNTYGVDVTNARGDRWTAYGDEKIHTIGNWTNRTMAVVATQLSRKDIEDALAHRITAVPASFAAEAFVPRPVDPSRDRWTGRTPTYRMGPRGMPVRVPDDYTRMRDHVIAHEGPDIVRGFYEDDNQVRAWVARMSRDELARLPAEEKIEMIKTLIGGFFSWISDDDVATMEKILASVQTESEMEVIRRALLQRATDFSSHGQRARFRLALQRRP